MPETVTADVPLLDTTAPLPPAFTTSVPSPTDSVIVSRPVLPSMSLTERPLFFNDRLACSVAL